MPSFFGFKTEHASALAEAAVVALYYDHEVYKTKLIIKSFSLFALALFSLSLFMTPPVANISAEESLSNSINKTMNNPWLLADYPDNYTRVGWDLGTINDERNQTWNSNHYRFGPTINWHTSNITDSSLIGWSDEIAINEYVDFIIEIPYSSLGGQTPSGVYLMGQYFNMSALANSEGEFHMEGNQPNMWMVYYNITGNSWLFYSTTNATWPEAPPTEFPSGFTLADIWGLPVDPYLEVDIPHFGYIAGAESYWANVRVRFNSSTIGGFYTISCGVQDEYFNSLAESRFEQFNSGRIIGTTFDFLVNQAVGGYYDWKRISDDGSTIYSATRGVDFNMTAAITNGTALSNATVLFDIPNQIRTKNWVYGPYTITEEVTGVWEYDNVSEAYVWNALKTVNWTAQKEGFHFEDGFTYLDTEKEYNFWDGGSIWPKRTSAQAAIVYDFSTGSFNTLLAYQYENNTWVTDESGGHWEQIRWYEYEPWPVDGSIPVPFVINELTSESYWNNSKLVVTFRGHIGNDMLPTSESNNQPMNVREMVTDIYGRNLVAQAQLPLSSPEAASAYNLLRELAVESPISIVTLTHAGEPYEPDWMFRTDVTEPFTVKSWLQGGAEYFEDIDGIGFFMKAHQEDWGFDGANDWHQWSDIEIQIRIDIHGVVSTDIFNRTVRNQWSQGDYWDWVMIEVMPGRWEPQWTLVTDQWHWEEKTWDFVDNDWTIGWISDESPSLRMPDHWLDVININRVLVGNDLRVVFDILPTPVMPQLEWQWEYFYGDLTWVEDYESGWGEHTILGWNENTVYSYLNGSKLYIDEPVKAEIFRNNQTGEFYQREKVPFVVINGKEEEIAPYLMTDMESNWEENVRNEYNYTTGEQEYFIKFSNGTEIQVYSGSVATLFNISLPQASTWFLGWGNRPQYTGIDDLFFMIAVNGTLIVRPWNTFWDLYTTQLQEVVQVTKVDYTYVTYLNGTQPFYMRGWPQYIGPDHYIMYRNGTYEPVEFWWNSMWGYYYWNITDGKLYTFEWPWELMTGIYLSKPFFIPQFMTNSQVFTLVSGIKYQLPAPGIPMWSPHELNNLVNIFNPANGRYFAKEYAIVGGVPYEALKLPVQEQALGPPSYWYDVYQIDTGIVYNLTDWSTNPDYRYNYDYGDYSKNLPWTTIANGSIWVPEVIRDDWTVAYGHRDTLTYEFIEDGWLDLKTGFYDGNYQTSQIQEWNSTGLYDYVLTKTGKEFFYNNTWRATFLNISLSNGTSFYSRMDHPIAEPTDIFQWEIDRYFMIDIYGNYQGWQGWMDYTAELVFVDDVIGEPWSGGQFFWNGSYLDVVQYPVDYWEWDGYQWHNTTQMEDNIVPHDYFFLQNVLNATEIYEIVELQRTPESYKFNFPSWVFNTTIGEYHAYGGKEIIYQAFKVQGYSMKLDYAPLPISIIRTQSAIVYGTPANGMWDNDVWAVDPLSGALDLDGNLDTTGDQFYVREIHSSTDYFNVTQQYLDVSILWDPDNSTWADEFYLHSYTGMVTFNWTYDWSELNIWTHSDGTSLTASEYTAVHEILFDSFGNPKPGYWGIAWMFENRTYADMVAQAQAEGWDWVEDNSREWSWLWWELDEQYSTEVSNGTHSDLMDVNLAYQYAGMFAWNDTSLDNFMNISSVNLGDAEMTHYWMPVDVESVTFRTPGESWLNYNTTDLVYRSANETVNFGVTFSNITGEVYPFGVRSYFDWYEGAYYGSDFETFDERPTQCLTSEFSIDVHFTGETNATGPNIAEVKFDISVGDWVVYTPGGRNVALAGRSLAIAFYSDLTIMTSGGMTADAIYINDLGQTVTNNEASASSIFRMASGLSDVAMMNLGGSPYIWSRNTSKPTNVDAQTVPIDAFSAIYVSGGGASATTFAISSEQFFTVIGFKWWDGWAVTVDPVFVGYISHGTSDIDAPSIGAVTQSPLQITGVDNAHIEAIVTDSGGSEIAEVKVYDIDNAQNYSMTYNEGLSRWIVNIPRTQDGRYTFNYQIIASDNAGNVAVSSPSAFPFRDNIAPVITTLAWDNSTDGFGNEIAVVSTQVADTGGSGIDEVILTYSNATGNYNVTMALNAGYYEGTIPNHAPSTTVSFWVTVTDVDGNYLEGSVNLFTFSSGGLPDTYGPSMSLITHNPESPTPSDIVTVSATIIDPSGISYVTLQYKIGSGVWSNVTMTAAGNTWSGAVPVQADGTSVTYRLVAMDTLGNEAISGEFSYTVVGSVVTTTTTTTSGETSPIFNELMIPIIAIVAGLLFVVVILVAIRKRG
jgi:hypothetical protein